MICGCIFFWSVKPEGLLKIVAARFLSHFSSCTDLRVIVIACTHSQSEQGSSSQSLLFTLTTPGGPGPVGVAHLISVSRWCGRGGFIWRWRGGGLCARCRLCCWVTASRRPGVSGWGAGRALLLCTADS